MHRRPHLQPSICVRQPQQHLNRRRSRIERRTNERQACLPRSLQSRNRNLRSPSPLSASARQACARCSFASSADVSITVTTGDPCLRGLSRKQRPFRHHAVNRAAQIGKAHHCLGTLQAAFGRTQLPPAQPACPSAASSAAKARLCCRAASYAACACTSAAYAASASLPESAPCAYSAFRSRAVRDAMSSAAFNCAVSSSAFCVSSGNRCFRGRRVVCLRTP